MQNIMNKYYELLDKYRMKIESIEKHLNQAICDGNENDIDKYLFHLSTKTSIYESLRKTIDKIQSKKYSEQSSRNTSQ